MKALAEVLATKVENGNLLAKLRFNGKLPQKGTVVTVSWGSARSLPQNSLYWVYLQWLIDNGLRDKGHFDSYALHLDLKAHFLSKGIKLGNEVTTTTMSKTEFSEYVEKIDQLMRDFFDIDTSQFWADYINNNPQ